MWYENLNFYLLQIRFTKCAIDPNVYIKCVSTHFVLLGLYVDESIVVNDNKFFLHDIKFELSHAFEIIDIGPIEFCLRIQVMGNVTNHSIHLSQAFSTMHTIKYIFSSKIVQ
jgi:hypothetical protein